MQKYDVQQLLRQQKDSIYQHILTVFLAAILGLSTAQIFEYHKGFLSTQLILAIAVAAILSLTITPVILVFIYRNDLIKIKKEKFTLLMIFDKKDNSIKPIQIHDYNFSVYIESNWNSVIGSKDEYIKKFKEARASNINPFDISYQKSFDYKVITDLIQYTILRKITDRIERIEQRKSYLSRWSPTLSYWYYRTINNIIDKLKKINSIDEYLRKKSAFNNLRFFSEGSTPLIFQPQQVQNNLFVKKLHEAQIKYEKEILRGGKTPDFYSLLPLYLYFPKGVKFDLEKSSSSALDKIILLSKFGKLTIEFHDRWRYNSQKAFFYTTMRPGHQHHPYEEIFFEVTIDLDIKKYAYFPVVGSSDENLVDDFFSWANQLIEDLRDFCDWDYHQTHLTRDLFEILKNQISLHDWEARVEYYGNFEDTEKGKIQRILRQTISPHFEDRKYAIDEIIKKKKEIPSDQLKIVVLRILRLTNYESITAFKAVEALGELSDKIPNVLHENVTNRLIELINSKDNFVKEYSLKSLGLLFNYVNVNLKNNIQEKIIQIYVKTEPISNWMDIPSSEALKLIYPKIAYKDQKKFEDYYLHILKSLDSGELIHALRFYFAVRRLISKRRVNEVTDVIVKINPIELKVLPEYLNFFSSWSEIVPKEFAHEYYAKLIFFMAHTDLKIKAIISLYVKNSSQFIASLNGSEKEAIYLKLKKHVYSGDIELKKNALESLIYLAKYFPGKEEEIGEILLCEIDSMRQPFEYPNMLFAYTASSCFDSIKENIGDTSLLKRILEFQKRLKG